jgi:peptidoglycan hydrolase CwlO-like protein
VNNHAEGARFVAEIKTAEAELAGPQDALSQADKKLRSARERLAGLIGMIETKKADLEAARSGASDEQLTATAENLERSAVGKDEQLAEKSAARAKQWKPSTPGSSGSKALPITISAPSQI